MDDILDLPKPEHAPDKRPVQITVVCIVNWAITLLAIVASVAIYQTVIINGNFIVSISYMALCAVACLGLWRMQRWAAITYNVACIIILVIMLMTRTWIWPVLIPIASVLVIEQRFKTLKRGLKVN